MNEFVRKANSGCFKKGRTAWNKGMKGVSGRKCGKGHQRFPRRPVIALNPDGTIYKKFPSVAEAQKYFRLGDRHSVTRACQQKYFCRGYRLLYEEDYVPWADYRNTRSRFRDIYGRLLKGHHNSGFRKPSAEKLERKSKCASERAKRMYADPNSKWGKPNGMIPVICVETGERFPSIKDCAMKLGIAPNQISAAITRHGSTHGYTFKKETSA